MWAYKTRPNRDATTFVLVGTITAVVWAGICVSLHLGRGAVVVWIATATRWKQQS